MRKISVFFAFVALGIGLLCSCKDDNEVVSAPEAEGPDYLVMMYAVGGGNLDDGIIGNIMQALDEGCDERVKMTFEYKLSDSLQHKAEYKDFEGTRRFTAEENSHLKGQFLSMTNCYPTLDEKELPGVVSKIKSERIGDAKYDMSCKEALAGFIKWSKEKYPKAKHKILVVSNHGGAWSMVWDGMKDTRAVLNDDNLKDPDLPSDYKGKSLSVQALADALMDGGDVDVMYLDACLMSTYENLYGYAKGVKYVLSAFETQPGIGGDYRVLTKLLKIAGHGEENMVKALKKYVDYCNDDGWWGSNNPYCTDLGLYNLSKLGLLTPVLKRFTDTLAELYESNAEFDCVSPEYPALGDTYAPYIRKAMTECLVSHGDNTIPVDSVPKTIAGLMKDDGVRLFSKNKFYAIDVIKWIRFAQTDAAKYAYENLPKEWAEVKRLIYKMNYASYSLMNLLTRVAIYLQDVGLRGNDNPFVRIYYDMMTALKDMAYIKCTKSPSDDKPYQACSPGVYLVPLNDLYYCEQNKSMVKYVPTYEEALRYYQNTEFDKQVGWNRVLRLLDVFPSAMTNTMRDYEGLLEPAKDPAEEENEEEE